MSDTYNEASADELAVASSAAAIAYVIPGLPGKVIGWGITAADLGISTSITGKPANELASAIGGVVGSAVAEHAIETLAVANIDFAVAVAGATVTAPLLTAAMVGLTVVGAGLIVGALVEYAYTKTESESNQTDFNNDINSSISDAMNYVSSGSTAVGQNIQNLFDTAIADTGQATQATQDAAAHLGSAIGNLASSVAESIGSAIQQTGVEQALANAGSSIDAGVASAISDLGAAVAEMSAAVGPIAQQALASALNTAAAAIGGPIGAFFSPNGPFGAGGLFSPNGPFAGVAASLGDYVNRVAGLFGYGMVDPIVLDLSGNGVQLTSLGNSNAFFDLYGTGFAVNTGWVGPQTALLVQAPAGGGPINSIADLFGSQSTDGFTALAALDTNRDGLIDAQDPGFASVQLWTDTNGNGGVDPGELQTLAQLGVVSIGLSATVVDQSANGNEIQRIATFTRSDGTTGEVAEVSLNNSRVDTQYTGAYQLNPAVLTLPNLRGYGTLPDLFIAASQDSVLLGLLQTLASQDLSSAVSLPDEVRAIMYRWAGVDGVAPDSRGAFVNAQDLGFLEKFLGQTFGSGVGDGANPANGHQGQSLEAAFNQVFSAIETRLLVQGPLAGLLPNVSSAQPPLRWAA